MKRFLALTLGLLSALGAAATASADPLQWDLSTLTFQGTSFPSGAVSTGTVTGSFTYNADTNIYTTWSIELSGFPGTPVPGSGLSLTPANTFCPQTLLCTATEFAIFNSTASSPFSAIGLFFAQPLTDVGGTVSIVPGSGILYLNTPNFGTFHLQSPGGSVTATPEPSTSTMVVLAIFGLCVAYQRRRIVRSGRSAQVAKSSSSSGNS